MNAAQIDEKIRGYLGNEVGLEIAKIEAADEKLFSDGHLDSMDILNMVSFIETEFGIRVNSLDISVENFDRVASIADYVRRKSG